VPAIAHDLSFYFFDIDDNLLFLSTSVYVTHSLTRQEIAITTGEFATIEGLLGHPGKWGDYRTTADSFRNFRDLAESEIQAGKQQPFLTDIAAALNDDRALAGTIMASSSARDANGTPGLVGDRARAQSRDDQGGLWHAG